MLKKVTVGVLFSVIAKIRGPKKKNRRQCFNFDHANGTNEFLLFLFDNGNKFGTALITGRLFLLRSAHLGYMTENNTPTVTFFIFCAYIVYLTIDLFGQVLAARSSPLFIPSNLHTVACFFCSELNSTPVTSSCFSQCFADEDAAPSRDYSHRKYSTGRRFEKKFLAVLETNEIFFHSHECTQSRALSDFGVPTFLVTRKCFHFTVGVYLLSSPLPPGIKWVYPSEHFCCAQENLRFCPSKPKNPSEPLRILRGEGKASTQLR